MQIMVESTPRPPVTSDTTEGRSSTVGSIVMCAPKAEATARRESVHTHSIPLPHHSPLFFGWDRCSPFHSGSRNIDGKLSPGPSPPALRPHIPLPVSLPDRHNLPFHGPGWWVDGCSSSFLHGRYAHRFHISCWLLP